MTNVIRFPGNSAARPDVPESEIEYATVPARKRPPAEPMQKPPRMRGCGKRVRMLGARPNVSRVIGTQG
jgi:hypothetical protein